MCSSDLRERDKERERERERDREEGSEAEVGNMVKVFLGPSKLLGTHQLHHPGH